METLDKLPKICDKCSNKLDVLEISEDRENRLRTVEIKCPNSNCIRHSKKILTVKV